MAERKYHFQVNLGGMLDILSNHLYKSPDVFLRELMQNGQDAVTLRKKRQPDWDEGMMKISLVPREQLTFSDNGAGLNREEVHKFLAVIGQSSKNIENGELPQDYIGRFGIGLLSCFMVSDTITVYTRCPDEKKGLCWCGSSDGTYTLKQVSNCNEGTSIVLKAKHGVKEYYEEMKIKELVRYYGLYLKTPIYFEQESIPLNEIPSQFRGNEKSQMLALGEWQFGEPFVDAIKIRTKHLSGIAYVLSYSTAVSVKQQHRIYLKDMLLTEDGSMLLPNWAFFLRCVLNTNYLSPTASRENFYENEELEEARKEFGGVIKNYLVRLQTENAERLSKIVSIHQQAVKSLAVWDKELFLLFIDYLQFETSEGQMSGKELKEMKKVSYADNIEKFKQLSPIFRAQGKLLVCGGYMFDGELLGILHKLQMIELAAVRANISSIFEELTREEAESAEKFWKTAESALFELSCQVKLSRFFPEEVPAIYSEDETMQFVRRAQNQAEQKGIFSMALTSLLSEMKEHSFQVLYLNVNNPIVQKLLKLSNETTIQNIVRILYLQAMLSGGYTPKREDWKLFQKEIFSLIENQIN